MAEQGQERVALAEIARPHGIRGELRLKLYNPASDVLQSKPRVHLVPREGEARWVRLVSVREVPGTLLVRLDGVRDREAADALRGAKLEVLRSILPEPEEAGADVVFLRWPEHAVVDFDVSAPPAPDDAEAHGAGHVADDAPVRSCIARARQKGPLA